MTTRNFDKYGSGNNMVNQEERGEHIDPDDVRICPECPKWDNEHHPDEMIRVDKEMSVCERCFKNRVNEYSCNNLNCAIGDFTFVGIPDVCPQCKTRDYLSHEFYRFPKQEKSVKRDWKGEQIK